MHAHFLLHPRKVTKFFGLSRCISGLCSSKTWVDEWILRNDDKHVKFFLKSYDMLLGMPKQLAISCRKYIVLLFNKKQSLINKFFIRLVCKYKKVPIHPKNSSVTSFRGKTARSISREMSFFFWYFLVFSSSLNTVFFSLVFWIYSFDYDLKIDTLFKGWIHL